MGSHHKVRPVGWSINRVTDYTQCERCKALKPPILEMVYMRSRRSRPQWHYLCEECGEGVCNGGLEPFIPKIELPPARAQVVGCDACSAALEKYRDLAWGAWRP